MHELRLAREIVTVTCQEMTDRRLRAVTAVGVRIGPLSPVDPHALTFGFEAAAADTPLEKTRLEIEKVPLRARCRACGHDFEMQNLRFQCPACGKTELDLDDEQELAITYIEGET